MARRGFNERRAGSQINFPQLRAQPLLLLPGFHQSGAQVLQLPVLLVHSRILTDHLSWNRDGARGVGSRQTSLGRRHLRLDASAGLLGGVQPGQGVGLLGILRLARPGRRAPGQQECSHDGREEIAHAAVSPGEAAAAVRNPFAAAPDRCPSGRKEAQGAASPAGLFSGPAAGATSRMFFCTAIAANRLSTKDIA